MYLNDNNEFSGSNNVFVIDVIWYNNVGIVLAQDVVTCEYKSYIKDITIKSGPEPYVDEDVATILAYGNTFPLKAAKELFHYDLPEGEIILPVLKERYPEYFL